MSGEQNNLIVFESVPRPLRAVPVQDDAFAPRLRCGEFAIIDTSNREPEEDAIVFVEGPELDSTYSAIVQLKAHKGSGVIDRPGRVGPYWWQVFGLQRVTGSAEAVENLEVKHGFTRGFIPMADGPLCDAFMREYVVGRVVGVMRRV